VQVLRMRLRRVLLCCRVRVRSCRERLQVPFLLIPPRAAPLHRTLAPHTPPRQT